MIKNYILIGFVLFSLLFVQCKREPISTNPAITNLSDYESNDGKINLKIKGGKAPYKVEWSNSASDTIINELAAGVYYVTITDAKNKVFVDTIVVEQPPYPVCIDAEGNNYKTAIIGSQVWMLENLRATKTTAGVEVNYLASDSSNTSEYGMLYTWKDAMADSTRQKTQGLCPDGWHIPSDKEWFELTDHIKQEGKEFNDVFEPQYAGFYNNGFNNQGTSVSYWSSTSARDNAWKRYVHKDLSKVFHYHEKKENAISVRCVRN